MKPLQNKPKKRRVDRAVLELQTKAVPAQKTDPKIQAAPPNARQSIPQGTPKNTRKTTPKPTPKKGWLGISWDELCEGIRTLWKRLLSFLKQKIASLPYLLPEGDFVVKALITVGLIFFFALLQTTVFARFRPFGAIPDLMLPLVIAIAMTEGEKWGAVSGIAAAFVIESLGSTGTVLLPLFYMIAGYFAPIVTTLYFTDSVPVRILYTAISGVGRAILTFFYLSGAVDEFHFFPLAGSVVLPEYAATFSLAILAHLTVHLSLHPFHKSRAERTETL